jgi:hypothetical protein
MAMENNPVLGRAAGARAHRVGPATPTPEVDSTVSLASSEMYRKGALKASRAPPFKPPERRPSLLGSSRGHDATLPSVPGRWP